MFDPDVVFEDPLSAVVYGAIDMSFVAAHSFAQIWVVHHGKNTDLDALKLHAEPAKPQAEPAPVALSQAA